MPSLKVVPPRTQLIREPVVKYRRVGPYREWFWRRWPKSLSNWLKDRWQASFGRYSKAVLLQQAMKLSMSRAQCPGGVLIVRIDADGYGRLAHKNDVLPMALSMITVEDARAQPMARCSCPHCGSTLLPRRATKEEQKASDDRDFKRVRKEVLKNAKLV